MSPNPLLRPGRFSNLTQVVAGGSSAESNLFWALVYVPRGQLHSTAGATPSSMYEPNLELRRHRPYSRSYQDLLSYLSQPHSTKVISVIQLHFLLVVKFFAITHSSNDPLELAGCGHLYHSSPPPWVATSGLAPLRRSGLTLL